MDARLKQRLCFAFIVACWACHGLAIAEAATSYATPNFVVYAPSAEAAKSIALAAEHYRRELAIEWLGHALPRWSQPCPIKVKIGQIGAGGATTFTFHPTSNGSAEVCGWDMQIQGSLERILDSVLPHEISHTIFACHFRRPLPRWADEGAATLVEHESERKRQILTVKQVLSTRRRIPLKQLLAIKEYPKDMQDVLTLYAEGYTLAELLVQQGGKARYLKFLADAHSYGWDRAITANYDYQGVDDLELGWREWIVAGCPQRALPAGQLLADNKRSQPASPEVVIRGQSPPVDPFLTAKREDVPRAVQAASSGRAAAGAPTEAIAALGGESGQPRESLGAWPRSAPTSSAATDYESGAPLGDELRSRGPFPRASSLAQRADAGEIHDSAARVRSGEDSAGAFPQAPAGPRFAAAPRRQPPSAAPLRHSDLPVSSQAKTSESRATWSEFPHDPRPSPFAPRGRS